MGSWGVAHGARRTDRRTHRQTDARGELYKGRGAFDGSCCAGAVGGMLSVAAISRFHPLATSPLGNKRLVVKQSLLNLREL